MARSRKQFQKRRRDPGEKRAGRPECGEDGKALERRRFLFTGSQAEYGVHNTLMDETITCRPASPLWGSKIKGSAGG